MTIFYSANAGGFYDSEIHGNAIPADAVEISEDQHKGLLAGQASGMRIVAGVGGVPALADPPPPTTEQVIASYTASVQRHLDETAKALGYDNIVSAVSYADEPAVPRFQSEGQSLRAWRSLVWAHCYSLLDAVQAGTIPAPTNDDLIAGLPAHSVGQ